MGREEMKMKKFVVVAVMVAAMVNGAVMAQAQAVPQMTGHWTVEVTLDGKNANDKKRMPTGGDVICVQSEGNVICAGEHTWSGAVTTDWIGPGVWVTLQTSSNVDEQSNNIFCPYGLLCHTLWRYHTSLQLTGQFTNPTLIEGTWKGEIVTEKSHYPIHGTWRATRTDVPQPAPAATQP
jgi:hypothetical protein